MLQQNAFDFKSALVQVMVWCRQATGQCWPRYMSPYGASRPQWVNSARSPYKFQDDPVFQINQINTRADSRLVPSQWQTSLQSNAVSLWLGANLESALNTMTVDVMVPYLTRSPNSHVMTVWYWLFLSFSVFTGIKLGNLILALQKVNKLHSRGSVTPLSLCYGRVCHLIAMLYVYPMYQSSVSHPLLLVIVALN